MVFTHEHPELAPLPQHAMLGPDPEPIGHRAHLPLLVDEQPKRKRQVARMPRSSTRVAKPDASRTIAA